MSITQPKKSEKYWSRFFANTFISLISKKLITSVILIDDPQIGAPNSVIIVIPPFIADLCVDPGKSTSKTVFEVVGYFFIRKINATHLQIESKSLWTDRDECLSAVLIQERGTVGYLLSRESSNFLVVNKDKEPACIQTSTIITCVFLDILGNIGVFAKARVLYDFRISTFLWDQEIR